MGKQSKSVVTEKTELEIAQEKIQELEDKLEKQKAHAKGLQTQLASAKKVTVTVASKAVQH